ncbi:MAG: J domain-containing protein [Desulfofustis sp. PB-SRB1]|jgi:hypothetical protein|nr:J domain-containing protein [Desulfofustis sp. PB-SRB1]MBM1002060.1 J domain-containing protein [Desulfofustis sp. PB-SRB1]HBH30200.1 J domain-containing protein [Desulfofustis sp.]HBH31257.1 J domain-containing protein [Desulfofustis sp.]
MMKTPYEILGVSENGDDGEIKKAYLDLVRRFPPERYPHDFQRIYRAFEQIKTAQERLSHRLFYCHQPEPSDIATLLLGEDTRQVPESREKWQQELAASLRLFCRELTP